MIIINRKLPIIGGFILLCFLASCSGQWLKPKPRSFFTPENVYIDAAGFKSLLVTMRKNLKSSKYGYFSWATAEYTSSDLAVGGYGPNFALLTPSGAPERYPVHSMITEIYGFLKNPNVLISRINDVKWKDKSVRNKLLARAYWHRAYLYYRLVNDYGNVPWIGKELKGAKLDFVTYSRWVILAKLQKDLEWAVDWLPVKADPGEVTKWAALQLLTKIYLEQAEFDKAIKAATKIINNGPFALMAHRFGIDANDPSRNVIWDLHRHQNIYDAQNTETILGIVDRASAPNGAKKFKDNAANYMPHYWDDPDESGSKGILYPGAQMDTLMRGQGITVTDKYYQYKIWKDKNHSWQTTPDLRRSDINWIEMSEIVYDDPDSPNFGEPIQQRWANPSDTTIRWYPWPHYLTYNRTDEAKNTWSGGEGDAYIYRLAGTYLLRAEAYFWKGELGPAADDINKVRKRTNAPLIKPSDVTIDYIFDERARELFTEEPRHAEMVRVSNIMAALHRDGYSLKNISQKSWWYDRTMRVNDLYKQPSGTWWSGKTVQMFPRNIYWPIPQSVITANTKGHINQNYGYQGYKNNVAPRDTIKAWTPGRPENNKTENYTPINSNTKD